MGKSVIKFSTDKNTALRTVRNAISGKFAILKAEGFTLKVGTPPFMIATIVVGDKTVEVDGGGAGAIIASTCASEIDLAFQNLSTQAPSASPAQQHSAPSQQPTQADIPDGHWAQVVSADGCGYLQASTNNVLTMQVKEYCIEFSKEDVESLSVLFTTSQWVKYKLVLKDASEYLLTFSTNKNLAEFESWSWGLLYGINADAPASTHKKELATPVSTCDNGQTPTYPNENQTPLQSDMINKEQDYIFALDMINRRSYNVAYNTLSKIKGYKDADELLRQLEDKI